MVVALNYYTKTWFQLLNLHNLDIVVNQDNDLIMNVEEKRLTSELEKCKYNSEPSKYSWHLYVIVLFLHITLHITRLRAVISSWKLLLLFLDEVPRASVKVMIFEKVENK